MSIFICPVCGEKLDISGKSYICPNRHTFDMAKSGYVNLLPTNNSGSVHGDNKLMLRARREFLEKGYYKPLCDAVCKVVSNYCCEKSVILDVGWEYRPHCSTLNVTSVNLV